MTRDWFNPFDVGVTKRCRLSWLTNGALEYEPKCGGFRVSANEYSCADVVQINFGDLLLFIKPQTARHHQLRGLKKHFYIFMFTK
jgi:hypothetical protein